MHPDLWLAASLAVLLKSPTLRRLAAQKQRTNQDTNCLAFDRQATNQISPPFLKASKMTVRAMEPRPEY
jgi:hypothetical protein